MIQIDLTLISIELMISPCQNIFAIILAAVHYKSTKVLKTDITSTNEPSTILPYRKTGEVHLNVQDLIRTAYGESVKLAKVGIPRGINSVLYCIITALRLSGNDDFLPSQDLVGEATSDRNRLSQIDGYTWTKDNTPLYVAVAAQQLFDMSEQEVSEALSSDINLDPRIYIRLIEEYYDINLIIFRSRRYGTDPLLVLPRYREFFSYHYRERPTIMIISHHGTRTTMSKRYPHCELISMDLNNNNQDKKLMPVFPSELARTLMYIGMESDVALTWVQDVPARTIHRYANPNSRFDWTQYNIYPTGQKLDNLGKVSALRFQHILGSGVLLIPPYEPFNVPIIEELEPLINYQTAIQIFGQPDSWDVNDDKIFGLWYHQDLLQEPLTNGRATAKPEIIDPSFRFYVCTLESPLITADSQIFPELSEEDRNEKLKGLTENELIEEYLRLLPNSNNPIKGEVNLIRYGLQQSEKDLMRLYLKARKTNYLVKTLLKWLFQIRFIKRKGDLQPKEFLEDYVTLIDKKMLPGEDEYNITNFHSQLPKFENIDLALEWIGRMDPTMITTTSAGDHYFAIYSPKYYENLVEELRVFRRVLDNFDIDELKIDRENISNFYTPWEDEIAPTGQISITTHDSFEQWLNFQEYITGNRVYTVISLKLRQSAAPFIYALESSASVPIFFLVQNVFRDPPSRAAVVAAYIADHWVTTKPRKNLGQIGIENRPTSIPLTS